MSELLKKFGFEVTTGVGGIETSVKAVYDTGKEGPNIGIFGEFDAVPGMGHSCGHNLMCAMAVGAGEAVHSVIDDVGGKVTVFGTPRRGRRRRQDHHAEQRRFQRTGYCHDPALCQ